MSQLFSIAIAYLKHHRRPTLVSLMGVAMGVAFFIGLSALFKGLQYYFIEQVINTAPHIIIEDDFPDIAQQPADIYYKKSHIEIRSLRPKTEFRGIRSAKRILEHLSSRSNLYVSPVLTGEIFLQYGNQNIASRLIGIIPSKEVFIVPINTQLLDGETIAALNSRANAIILGVDLAKKLGAKKGDNLIATSVQGIQLPVNVVALYESSITALNSQSYMLLNKVQILQKKKNIINQIRIKVKDDTAKAKKIASELQERYKYKTTSWEDVNKSIFVVFVIQNSVMYTTIFALIIVAVFGMYNIISTIVNEKKRDIAILKSIGFLESDVQVIFLWQGVIIGVIGALTGWVLGFGIIEVLDSIKFQNSGFANSDGFILYKSFSTYIISLIFAVSASILASYLPARKAAALQPVDIIRGGS